MTFTELSGYIKTRFVPRRKHTVLCKNHSVNFVQENTRCFFGENRMKDTNTRHGQNADSLMFQQAVPRFCYWTFKVRNRSLHNFGALSLRRHTSCVDYPVNRFIGKIYWHVYV
jgi:hypothetical protein